MKKTTQDKLDELKHSIYYDGVSNETAIKLYALVKKSKIKRFDKFYDDVLDVASSILLSLIGQKKDPTIAIRTLRRIALIIPLYSRQNFSNLVRMVVDDRMVSWKNEQFTHFAELRDLDGQEALIEEKKRAIYRNVYAFGRY